MDQLRAIRYFIKVVETGSFTKAASTFNVPPSSLSRRVVDLEKSLGATLLKRTTRLVKLTEVGQIYYNDVQQIVNQLEQSHETVRSYQTTPMGRLSISSMVSFGDKILLPLLDEFNALYPEIILDVSFSDELSTLGRDDVDIAIRGGYAPNERVLAIKLMDNEFIPVASPGYLQQHGVPSHAMALKHHNGLYFKTPLGPTPWLCKVDEQWHDVSGPAVVISNNGAWLSKKACNGEGILMSTRWALAPYLESGELQELKFEHQLAVTQNSNMAIYLLYQKQRYLVPKVKAAVDFLVQKIKVEAD
ncbi:MULTISPECIES: LysR family transcriptional regulator [Pseudoalteromonas]|uniref:LysR family transcriptional regulator n=1 Tax=Pseudoalteromonas TaxID=53246 RepID=UPI0012316D53|nr:MULTISPECIES: LysR family transcriptional regulator [Pseudoalteromonas]MBB1334325.1 LysR family transcriptional regulator [Pseudoalteromonas sp. SR41-6]MBB1342067.1 LysR family transcriptional regulator [Pseudoalteromonas sp. SR45-6]MBB1417628.1 LysR family transcriptional regulator [Pseudoalteromonas sp. SG44-1]MBB1459884.1 LysR family transcriptional regulator [Pseudoalteromonas sp. SG41-8]MBB1469674.1 LysR family transcriptional regulator [Pseudoalteromonas sp. SG41-5]